VERLVAGAAAGDEGDLAGLRAAGPQDELLDGLDRDEVRVGRPEAGQALGHDVIDGVDELLHRVAGGIRCHVGLLSRDS